MARRKFQGWSILLSGAVICFPFVAETQSTRQEIQVEAVVRQAETYDRRVILIDPSALNSSPEEVLKSLIDLIEDPENSANDTRIAFASGNASTLNANGLSADEIRERVMFKHKRNSQTDDVPNLWDVQGKLRSTLKRNEDRLHVVWIGGVWSAGPDMPDPFRRKISGVCLRQRNNSAIDKFGEVDIDIFPVGAGKLPPDQAAEVMSSILFADGTVRFLGYVGPGCTSLDWAKTGVISPPEASGGATDCEPASLLSGEKLSYDDQNRPMPICNRYASLTVGSSSASEGSLLHVTENPMSPYDITVVLRPLKGDDFRALNGANNSSSWGNRVPGKVEVILEVEPKGNGMCQELSSNTASIQVTPGGTYFKESRRMDIAISGLQCDSELHTPYLVHAMQWELL